MKLSTAHDHNVKCLTWKIYFNRIYCVCVCILHLHMTGCPPPPHPSIIGRPSSDWISLSDVERKCLRWSKTHVKERGLPITKERKISEIECEMRGRMCDDAGAHFEQQKALLWSGRGSSHVNWFGLSESCQLDEKKEKQTKKKKKILIHNNTSK